MSTICKRPTIAMNAISILFIPRLDFTEVKLMEEEERPASVCNFTVREYRTNIGPKDEELLMTERNNGLRNLIRGDFGSL